MATLWIPDGPIIPARLRGDPRPLRGNRRRRLPKNPGNMMLVYDVELLDGEDPMTAPIPPTAHPPGRDTAGVLPRVLLASRSPRRQWMLEQHGIPHQTVESGVDDGELRPGDVDAAHWVVALAYLKAAAALSRLGPAPDQHPGHPRVVLGADTVVVDDGQIIGQPRDRDDAERILRRLVNGRHDVVTGVAILEVGARGAVPIRRDLFVDRATVQVGHVSESDLRSYLDSDRWRGKAGAYNLAERLAAGWPIAVSGDEGTVMGLPMRRLPERLSRFARRGQGPSTQPPAPTVRYS